MVLNLTRREDDVPCQFADWRIVVATSNADTIEADAEVWDATWFEPPVQISGVRRYTGTIDDTSDVAEYRLFLQAGDVLNVYAGTLNGVLDTVIILTDAGQVEIYIQDDDGGGGFNSFFSYVVEADGEYLLLLGAAVPINEDSDYEVIIGINEDI